MLEQRRNMKTGRESDGRKVGENVDEGIEKKYECTK